MSFYFKRSLSFLLIPSIFLFFILSGAGAFEARLYLLEDFLEDKKVLDLNTAAKIALLNNPSFELAKSRIQQAYHLSEEASSSYWPKLDAAFSMYRLDLAENSREVYLSKLFSDLNQNNPENYYSTALRLNWLLFDGFARKFKSARAVFGEKISFLLEDETKRLLFSALSKVFLEAKMAFEEIGIARADMDFNLALLRDAELRHRAGTASLSDLLNFEIYANSAENKALEAEKRYKRALISLAAILALPDMQIPEDISLAPLSSLAFQELEDLKSDKILERALKLRPDFLIRDFEVLRKEADIDIARAELYYPLISFEASIEGQRASDPSFSRDDFNNSLALNFSYNIFSGNLYKAKKAYRKAELIELEKNKEITFLEIKSEINKLVSSIDFLEKQLSLHKKKLKLVEKNRDLLEKEYRGGKLLLITLNEAQRDFVKASADLARLEIALHQALFDLKTASGEIIQLF